MAVTVQSSVALRLQAQLAAALEGGQQSPRRQGAAQLGTVLLNEVADQEDQLKQAQAQVRGIE